jgi:hypothetical protein
LIEPLESFGHAMTKSHKSFSFSDLVENKARGIDVGNKDEIATAYSLSGFQQPSSAEYSAQVRLKGQRKASRSGYGHQVV